MAEQNESIKEKSNAVTSATKASRQASNARQNTPAGSKLHTDERDAMLMCLARIIDVTHSWPCKKLSKEGKLVMPRPMIVNGHVIIAFPDGGHVIKNTVTSKRGQNFEVDGVLVIPVTSEAK
jgi:hypothetical protein